MTVPTSRIVDLAAYGTDLSSQTDFAKCGNAFTKWFVCFCRGGSQTNRQIETGIFGLESADNICKYILIAITHAGPAPHYREQKTETIQIKPGCTT